MSQGGATMALALAAFSVPWTGPEISGLPMPEVEPPSPERRPGALIAPEQGGPPFGRHIIFHPRIGGVPFAGGEQPMEAGGWLGLVEPRPLDAPALAFFTDALIPGPFMRLRRPTPLPRSTSRSLPRRASARPARRRGRTDRTSWCSPTRASAIHEGFFEEDALIWARDGTLLAQSRQLALLVG